MGVTWDFSDVYKSIDDELNELLNKLIYAGELAVQTAVQNGRYQNITGNLRSSIGYVLARDGKIIKEGGFNKVAGFGANMQRVRFTTISGKDVNFIARGESGEQAGFDICKADSFHSQERIYSRGSSGDGLR